MSNLLLCQRFLPRNERLAFVLKNTHSFSRRYFSLAIVAAGTSKVAFFEREKKKEWTRKSEKVSRPSYRSVYNVASFSLDGI